METNFKYWMSFYGKIYSPFKLVHGDFLDAVHQPGILASTIVFVNNFAFGPEVDQHLKDIFADLNDGARIFSSKSFCALNFRITERNLSGKSEFSESLMPQTLFKTIFMKRENLPRDKNGAKQCESHPDSEVMRLILQRLST